ncbi:MAG: DciA family protein [Paracoccaceae bacterium]|nr:DciA family protein [Paracoccaceae bacterium]MDE2758767.1 DciA family protein [Paracoccaceae bacterium]MDE2917555.1 DciA family protein [Paracoccaceae bacterium]
MARVNAEQKGISKHEILSSWNEIVGESLAAICRPLEVNHRYQFSKGSKLIVETPRGYAQQVEMQKDQIIERVNIAYGFGAIRRLEIKHTSYDAFHNSKSGQRKTRKPVSECESESWQIVKDIEEDELRTALLELGKNVLAQDK